MARVKKPAASLEAMIFSTPEQKVLRLLLLEPTTTFSIRVISSKLKGIRGLGGTEGITKILLDFQSLGLVEFVDNQRAVRLQDESTTVFMLKALAGVCDVEGLRKLLEPISARGILFGSRASGRYRTDSDYDIFVVSDNEEEVRRVARGYPLGKPLEIVVMSARDFDNVEKKDSELHEKLSKGITLWGSSGW